MYRKALLVIVSSTVCVFTGWFASLYFYAGESAMTVFMNVVAAMKYLEKGEKDRAFNMLQIMADAQLIRIDKYGTPFLDWHSSQARPRFVKYYTDIRYSDADYLSHNPEFKEIIDDILYRYNTENYQNSEANPK